MNIGAMILRTVKMFKDSIKASQEDNSTLSNKGITSSGSGYKRRGRSGSSGRRSSGSSGTDSTIKTAQMSLSGLKNVSQNSKLIKSGMTEAEIRSLFKSIMQLDRYK